MAYRDDREALELQLSQLEHRLLELRPEREALQQQLRHARELERTADRRVREAGPGGGWRDARRDRIGLAVLILVLVNLPLIYFHIEWHRYVSRDATVIPAILWLGTPALLGALVCWPYRRRGASFTAMLWASLLFVGAPLINITLGLL